MQLLKYREKINTECTLVSNPAPILSIKAIKIDGTPTGLKIWIGKGNTKSCDYLTQRNRSNFFIEISDFYAQLSDLQNKTSIKNPSKKTLSEAKEYIFNEIISKLQGTNSIFVKLVSRIQYNQAKQDFDKKALLVTCKESSQEAIVFAQLQRELKRDKRLKAFKLETIKFIPYKELEKILSYKKSPTTH
jgi:hypothetical protein